MNRRRFFRNKKEKMCENNIKYSKQLMDSVNEDFDCLVKIIDAFNGKADEPINRIDLLKFEIGKWYQLNDKIKIRRRQNRFKTYLNFDTKIENGGEFGKHFHKDLIESCEVLRGELKDLSTGEVFGVGDVCHYEKGVPHTPVATKDTELHVLFKA